MFQTLLDFIKDLSAVKTAQKGREVERFFILEGVQQAECVVFRVYNSEYLL